MAKTKTRKTGRKPTRASATTKKKRSAAARQKAAPNAGRRDQRFKNAAEAPTIVSEKRLTFFLPAAMYTEMRLLAGHAQVANAERGAARRDADALPESPSALLREAVEFYLDHLRRRPSKTPRAWESRLKRLKALPPRDN